MEEQDSSRLMVPLTSECTLSADQHNWIIIYEKIGPINPDTGKPKVSKRKTYHPTIVGAVQAVISRCTKESEVESVGRLIEFQGELSQKLIDTLSQYDEENQE